MTEQRRGGTTASTRPGAPAYTGSRLDGRLDLDDLDAPLDLDVIGADPDRPLLSEHLRRRLESTGIAPFVRRHRAPVVALTTVAVLLLGSGGWWWVSRPVPLPDSPLLLVKTSGPDRTQAAVDAGDGTTAELTLHVAVASVERPGVRVELVALTGPGLSAPGPGPGSVVDTSVTDSVVGVRARLDCSSPASTTAALAAEPGDFGVVVRRTAPEGENREDTIRLVGAQRVAQVVRATCLQAAADRDLSVSSVTATPIDGVAAADLDLTLTNTGTRTWPALRTSTRALPWLVNGRAPVDLGPGDSVTIRARLWLEDCANPTASLADGIDVRTSTTPEDAEPNAPDNAGNVFSIPVGAAERVVVDRAFASVCASRVPVSTVTQAVVRPGGSESSAGILELTLAVEADGAALMEVSDSGRTAGGTLTVLDNPVHISDGVGVLHATWELPRCTELFAAGIPSFSVNLIALDGSGGERRPYLMGIGGNELRAALGRVCGEAAVSLLP